jgi:hypothetical protein
MRRCSACSLIYSEKVANPSFIYRDGYLTGGSQYGADLTDPIMAAIATAAG